MTVALAFLTLPGVIVLAAPAGTALADVCASAGRRISVGGCVNIADAVYLLNFLYRGGPRPPAPFPQTGAARR